MNGFAPASIAFLFFASAALAQEILAPASVPSLLLTLQDLSGRSSVAARLPMIPGRSHFGMASQIRGQFALGDWAFGLLLPMAAEFPEGSGDSAFMVGNPTIDVNYRSCTGGNVSVCYGAGLGLGFAVMDPSNVSEAEALLVGIVSLQDFVGYLPDSVVVRPLLLVGLSGGPLLGQLEIGPGILIPTDDANNEDVRVVLDYGIGLGIKLENLVVPVIEFRGLTMLNGGNRDSMNWLNFGLRFLLGGFSPMVRLTLPLSDDSDLDAPLHLEVALAYQF